MEPALSFSLSISLCRGDQPEVVKGAFVEAAGAGVDVGAVVGVVPDHNGGHAAGDHAGAAGVAQGSDLPPAILGGRVGPERAVGGVVASLPAAHEQEDAIFAIPG